MSYFDKLCGMTFYNRFILSHMPVHPNSLGSRWMLNVHGHLHSKLVQEIDTNIHRDYPLPPFDKNYFNVSCEQNNLTPIHMDVIRDRLKEIE